MSSPTDITPPEAAMNLNMTFEDIDVIHEALIQWASQILSPEDARIRIGQFADFVIRHPELFTAATIMKGARR